LQLPRLLSNAPNLNRVFAWEKIGLQFSSGLEILGSGEFTTIHRKPTRFPKVVNKIN
jgi:hypothetical protein